jgi:beta-glucanase (GH16 family)
MIDTGLPATEHFLPHYDPPLSGYVLSFSDEFESLDRYNGERGTWKTWYGNNDSSDIHSRSLPQSGQLQVYVDPEFRGSDGRTRSMDPFRVRNGVLYIEARPASANEQPSIWGRPFTSGLITTEPSFAQLYGYFEIRVQVPLGKGFWPAFWLASADGSWPPEIDIFEILGDQPNVIHQTVHGDSPLQDSYFDYHGIDASSGFHTYGLEWTCTEISWYVDGVMTHRAKNYVHKPMYLLVNLAVGGDWPGAPDEETRFPGIMKVDYVRVYQERPESLSLSQVKECSSPK